MSEQIIQSILLALHNIALAGCAAAPFYNRQLVNQRGRCGPTLHDKVDKVVEDTLRGMHRTVSSSLRCFGSPVSASGRGSIPCRSVGRLGLVLSAETSGDPCDTPGGNVDPPACSARRLSHSLCKRFPMGPLSPFTSGSRCQNFK
jgi:hypothetical protein